MTSLPLLRSIEAISSCRDRDRLPRVLLRAVGEVLGPDADVGIFSRDAQGSAVLRVFSGPTIMNSAISLWEPLLNEFRHDRKRISRLVDGHQCVVLALQTSELGGGPMILAFNAREREADDQCERISCLARIYGHQIKLLDYSELDTLTRLLNRKTFDETFDRLLNSSIPDDCDDDLNERRNRPEQEAPAWLCVVDVDHFKRVNDSFGHLFGDEVLLRMGDLMRKTFRSGDRLFRFGGEEFVVILNAEDESLAAASFNRFRMSVERHEFPQVGKVTCSIGFTAVSAMDVPTDVVGRADEALYFAKENGRNQVCCYERLLAEGVFVKPASVETSVKEALNK